MEAKTPYLTRPLKPNGNGAIIDARAPIEILWEQWREYQTARIRELQAELNVLRRQLAVYQKCPQCGGEVR